MQQTRITQEAKFSYSRLCKALEKQVKFIEKQGEKHKKVIEEQGEKHLVRFNENIKKDDYDGLPFHDCNDKNKRFFRQRKRNKKKGIKTINKSYKLIDFNNLLYKYKSGDTLDFGFITNPKDIFDGIISNKLKLNRSFESLS